MESIKWDFTSDILTPDANGYQNSYYSTTILKPQKQVTEMWWQVLLPALYCCSFWIYKLEKYMLEHHPFYVLQYVSPWQS